jgi:hypothetical protein
MIVDQGIGIPEKDRSKVFDRFYRLKLPAYFRNRVRPFYCKAYCRCPQRINQAYSGSRRRYGSDTEASHRSLIVTTLKQARCKYETPCCYAIYIVKHDKAQFKRRSFHEKKIYSYTFTFCIDIHIDGLHSLAAEYRKVKVIENKTPTAQTPRIR